MQKFLMAGLALPLLTLPVMAQMTTAPATTTPTPSTAPMTGPMTTTPMTTTPMTTKGPMDTTRPAGTDTGMAADKMATAGGLAGANSFTESQARSRLEKDGFSNVSALAKDKDGVWRGRASKGAAEQDVGVDYKGNVIAN